MMNLLNSLKFGSGNIVKQEEGYTLTRPLNSWDMNYRIYDENEGITYLIDIEDMEHDLDFEELKELAWRIEEINLTFR